jgi:hypothetical protein
LKIGKATFIFTAIITISALVAAASQSVPLASGWNMVSVPAGTPMSASSLKAQCPSSSDVWAYDQASTSYVAADTLLPGVGYWFKSNSACSFSVSGPIILNIPSLKAGWNLIGALATSTAFSSMKGSCVVTSGPWKYNTATANYEQATTLEPGYGYWIEVQSDCNLLNNVQNICSDGTPYGACSSSKPLYCNNGNLTSKCSQCGCASNQICLTNGICEGTGKIGRAHV